MTALKVMDLFAGAGGLSLGLARAGFQAVAANEIEPVFADSYRLNHPEARMITGDINDPAVKRELAQFHGEIDLLAGGPPCQGFSTVGSKREDDPRNALFWSFLEVAKQVHPQVILFENVSGFRRMYEGRAYTALIASLEEMGYSWSSEVMNALNYGLPQSRERTVVIAFAKGSCASFAFPQATHQAGHTLFGSAPFLAFNDALSDLPSIKSGESSNEYASPPRNAYQTAMRKGVTKLTEHEGPNHGDSLLRVIRSVPPGGSILDVAEELRPKSYFANTYARLRADQHTPTMTRNFGTPSSSRCIHPTLDRGLTTREGARLQSFPDSYQFIGGRSQKNLQIGNAVPPLLGEVIGNAIGALLESASHKRAG